MIGNRLKFINCSTALLVILLLLSVACRPNNGIREVNRFAAEFDSLRRVHNRKISALKDPAEQTRSADEKKRQLELLLQKYSTLLPTGSSAAQLIRARVLIELGRFADADTILDHLTASESEYTLEAKMARVQVLIYSDRVKEASDLFRSIEPQYKRGEELYSTWLYFILYGEDSLLRKQYAEKFLEVTDMPLGLTGRKGEIYRIQALDALDAGDFVGAAAGFKLAVAEAADGSEKKMIQAEADQLELMGKTAPLLHADDYINATAVQLPELINGRPYLVVFRAPWSGPGRSLTPLLLSIFQDYKDKGLTIIDYTRLYGNFSDETGDSGPTAKKAEIRLLDAYCRRNKIVFPTLISHEGTGFDAYKVSTLPAVFFVDKRGKVAAVVNGSRHPYRIYTNLKKIMEE